MAVDSSLLSCLFSLWVFPPLKQLLRRWVYATVQLNCLATGQSQIRRKLRRKLLALASASIWWRLHTHILSVLNIWLSFHSQHEHKTSVRIKEMFNSLLSEKLEAPAVIRSSRPYPTVVTISFESTATKQGPHCKSNKQESWVITWEFVQLNKVLLPHWQDLDLFYILKSSGVIILHSFYLLGSFWLHPYCTICISYYRAIPKCCAANITCTTVTLTLSNHFPYG